MGLVVIVIIIFVSVFCIKNSFDISITEKTKQYGMLASIGSTSKQIKHNVYYEGFLLGLIGIPLGIICGVIASYILIIICNYFLKDAINTLNSESALLYETNILAIIFSIILSIITIYLSCRKSAKRASKTSPINAIRSNNDIKITRKKIKSPKFIKKIFGIGGDVSYKNLKRNKSKYRTIIISIIVCVSAYIGLTAFMGLAFKTINLEVAEVENNITINLNENKETNDKLAKEILSLDNINRYVISKSSNILIDKKYATKEYIEKFLGTEESNVYIYVKSLGDEEYKKFIKSLNLKYEDVKNKGILLHNKVIYYEYDEKNYKTYKQELTVFKYKENDKIKGIDPEGEEIEIELVKISDKAPFAFNRYYGDSILIVSDELINKLNAYDETLILIDSSDADKLQQEAELILKDTDYNLNNSDKNYRIVKSLYTLIAIFLYGFIFVIALIGITNIFNTITTSMELRSREFATLKSIGMTKKEFNHMIALESIFYGLKSLLIGIPIGIIISILLHKALIGNNIEFQYQLPLNGILISSIAVFLLLFILMKYSMNKVNKKNIIDTIRNENI